MGRHERLFGLSLLAAVLAACTSTGVLAPGAPTPVQSSPNGSTGAPRSPSSPLPVESPSLPPAAALPTPVPLTQAAIESCPVTFPNGSTPPHERYPSPDHHGNGALWATLGPGGKIVIRPGGAKEDGSILWKMGWYRGVRGKVSVAGRRLDAPAPPAQGHYDIEGYGDLGFQAGSVHFPSEGCWEITGRVGEASLTFVTLVVKVSFDPAWPHWGPEGSVIKDYDVTDLPKTIRLIFGQHVVDGDQVTWGEGEMSVETTQGVWENRGPYPDAATQQLMVHGQPGVCVQGGRDEQGQWQAGADLGALEWTGGGFSYRVSYIEWGLGCDDLLHIAEQLS